MNHFHSVYLLKFRLVHCCHNYVSYHQHIALTNLSFLEMRAMAMMVRNRIAKIVTGTCMIVQYPMLAMCIISDTPVVK